MIMAVSLTLLAAAAAAFAAVRLRRRKNIKCCRTLLLIPVTADDTLFERRVKACYWEEAFADPAYAKEILLVIMQPSANAFAAQRLAQEYSNVHTVHISALKDYIIRSYGEYECKKTDS